MQIWKKNSVQHLLFASQRRFILQEESATFVGKGMLKPSIHGVNKLPSPLRESKPQFLEGHRTWELLLGNLIGISRASNSGVTTTERVNRH